MHRWAVFDAIVFAPGKPVTLDVVNDRNVLAKRVPN